MLLPNERLDDLLTHQLHIVQSPEVFSFSMDAVLLARFVSLPARGQILDLCSGNGVIALLMTTRTQAMIDAVEIQPRLADMARRSIEYNKLDAQVQIIEADLRSYHLQRGYGYYDVITVNPPYMPVKSGEQNENEHQALARHEISCNLDDVTAACARLVRTGGKVAMVHRPSRMADIIESMRKVRLEPKRLRFVHPYVHSEANMVLIEAVRDAKPDMRLLPPLIVYNDKKQYNEEIHHIYYGSSQSEQRK